MARKKKNKISKVLKKVSKRKAFTLIELLAVVVILGLLVAIAYPAVNKYILETKDTTYTLHESDMKTAAKNMMSECIQNDTEDCVPESGESKTIYLSELIDTKYSNPIKDPDNKDGYCKNDRSYVIVTNTGDSTVKLEYDVCLTCDKYASGKCSELEPGGKCDSTTDTTPPTCGEVVGGSTLWTNKDRVISIKCNDVGCGCTKKSFYKTFTETSQKGSITITDKAGRSTSCEVNVFIDKDEPTCELEIIGTIGENEWYGNEAPIVRFKTNGKKDTTSGIATYGMGLSSKNLDFNKKDSYTAPTGITTIYGYVKDNAGNVGTCHVEVKYDSVPATLDKTDYGSIVYPKSDIASVDSNKRIITLDKTILDEYGDIYGLYFYQKSTSTGMTVTAKTGAATVKTVTLSGGVTKPIRILFDSAIRIGEYDLTIDLGANNKVDSISRIEVITRNDTVGYYTNQNVTLYLNSHDSLSGKAYYTFDGTNYQEDNYYTFTQNTNGVVVSIKDHAGNITEATTLKITNIDKIKPSCEVMKSRTKDGNGIDWYNKSVDIIFKSGAQVDAPSTSAYAMSEVRDWSLNNTTGRGNPKNRTQTTETSSTTDTGYVIDNAGNINTCSTEVKLDLTDPIAGTVTMTAGGSSISSGAEVNQNVTVTLANGSDTGSVQSGHYTTKFTVVRDGTTVSNSITGSETYTAEGNYTVTVTTYDQSGRYSTRSYTFMIDKTAPVCGTNDGKTTWINSSRKVTVNCSDPNGVAKSGCTASSFSNTWSSSTTTSSITIRDQAGNTTPCGVNVYVDVDKPVCGSNTGSTTWTNSSRTIRVNCSDPNGNGRSGCTASSFSDTWSSTTKTSSITIKDVAGNTQSCSVNVYVDKTNPYCTITFTANNQIGSSVEMYALFYDAHSGMPEGYTSKWYRTHTLGGDYEQSSSGTFYAIDNAGNAVNAACGYNIEKYCAASARCEAAGCNKYSNWKGYGGYMVEDCEGKGCCSAYAFEEEYHKVTLRDESCSKDSNGVYQCTCKLPPFTRTCEQWKASLSKCGCSTWRTKATAY